MTTAALLELVAKWRAEADRLNERADGVANGVVVTALVSSATMSRACATELERAMEAAGAFSCCGAYGGTHQPGIRNSYCDCLCHQETAPAVGPLADAQRAGGFEPRMVLDGSEPCDAGRSWDE